ncbi:hypothetical protein Tco_1432319, partial [Tanacetum coccineum]
EFPYSLFRSRAQLVPESLRGIFMGTMLYHVLMENKLISVLVEGVTNPYVMRICYSIRGMVDFVPVRAMIVAAHSKQVKYEAKCAGIGYGFLPFHFLGLGN